MKRVLVTGSTGFIGSHLVERLVQRGNNVRALIEYNSFNFWGWLENLPSLSEIEIVKGDVRDYDSVYSAMKGCSEVLHLAALIGIPYSYDTPLAYIRTNIEGTYNILQSARMLELENVIITSTSETYGTAQFVPITEEHPLVAQSPYSATKIGPTGNKFPSLIRTSCKDSATLQHIRSSPVSKGHNTHCHHAATFRKKGNQARESFSNARFYLCARYGKRDFGN